jgi:hypothetical protein
VQEKFVNSIIELLEENGLTTPKAVEKTVLRWPAREALGFALAMNERLDRKGDLLDENQKSGQTPFNFVASSILGGRSGCGEWKCRVRRSQLLGRYAALYSDTLVVPWHMSIPERIEASDNFRYHLAGDIMSVLAMRPVVEEGIVKLVQPQFHYCPDCASRALAEVTKVKKATAHAFFANKERFSVKIVSRQGSRPTMFSVNGPTEYLEHGGIIVEFPKPPSWLPHGGIKKLSKRLVEKSGLIEHVFDLIAGDIIFQQLCGVQLDAKLLTTLPGEAEILSLLGTQDDTASAAISLCAQLTHEIPLLSNLDIREVLTMRKEEPTAFDQYRVALSGILTDYVRPRKTVGTLEAKKIYRERLLPELVRLRREVETHQRKMHRKSVVTAATAGLIVALGITAGLTSTELAAMGTGALMGGLSGLLGEASAEPDLVKNNQMYFLLKLAERSTN